jgi:hypothetical protein
VLVAVALVDLHLLRMLAEVAAVADLAFFEFYVKIN